MNFITKVCLGNIRVINVPESIGGTETLEELIYLSLLFVAAADLCNEEGGNENSLGAMDSTLFCQQDDVIGNFLRVCISAVPSPYVVAANVYHHICWFAC